MYYKLIFFSVLWYFLKEIENMFSIFLSSYRNIHESLGELDKSWLVFPQYFLFSQIFTCMCFYNLIKTQYMCSIS